MTEALGFIMMVTPFILIFVYAVYEIGIKATISIFASIAFLIAWVSVACELVEIK